MNSYSIMEGERAASVTDYRYEKWYQEIIWADTDKVLFADNEDKENADFIYSMVYRIEDVYEDKTVGYLKIDMDLNVLKDRFLHNYTNVLGVTISDGEGSLLFWEGEALTAPDEIYRKGEILAYETDRYIMSCSISESTGWKLCVAMSKDEIFSGQRIMAWTLVGILVVIIFFTILISGKCFSIITVNFKRLAEGMELVKKGDRYSG